MMLDLSTPCEFLPNRKPEKNGYVRVGRGPTRKMAHRKAYEDAYGPIPESWTIDHECHNADITCPGGVCLHRSCINPKHLEAKPSGINTLAGSGPAAQNFQKTHCSNGHPYTEKNTYMGPTKGDRQCRMCKFLHHQEQLRRRKVIEYGLSLDDIGTIS